MVDGSVFGDNLDIGGIGCIESVKRSVLRFGDLDLLSAACTQIPVAPRNVSKSVLITVPFGKRPIGHTIHFEMIEDGIRV